MTVKTQIQVRRDTAANWTSVNPTLAAGEIGFETDTLKFKIGTGSTVWASLAYQGATGATGPIGPTGPTGAGYAGITSTSLFTIGTTGSKTFALNKIDALAVGSRVRLANSAAPANYMEGIITAIDTGAVSITVNVDLFGGSGTVSGWNLSIAGAQGPTGPAPIISPNSIALGTDTTGDYVGTLTAGTNLSISAGSGTGEGSTPTLSTLTTPSFSTITSTVATGTSPLTVASTTAVSNLNADLLDGQHGSWYTPSGIISPYAGLSAPTGWLFCDGSSVSRTTYVDLWSAISLSKGAVTSISNPGGLVTLNGHGLAEGDSIYFTTTGTLPTGLSANTIYYVKFVSVNTFNLATTRTATASSGSAASFTTGAAITVSSAGSGTHTVNQAPYGIPAGSATNFLLPDMRGRTPVGLDNINGTDAGVLTIPNAIGARSGEQAHTLLAAEIPAHTHTAGQYDAVGINNFGVAAGGDYQALVAAGAIGTRIAVAANTGGGGVHNVMQPFMLVNYIIKI